MAVSDQAANRLYQMVRDFAATTKEWEEAIRYYTKPDERYDLFLVSWRVYGTDAEWQIIQAAAGIDSPEFQLVEQQLILPNKEQLRTMRQKAGFSGYEIV